MEGRHPQKLRIRGGLGGTLEGLNDGENHEFDAGGGGVFVFGVEEDDAMEVLEGFGEFALVVEDLAAIGVGGEVPRLEADRHVVAADSGVVVVEFLADRAEEGIEVGVGGIEIDEAVEDAEDSVELSLRDEVEAAFGHEVEFVAAEGHDIGGSASPVEKAFHVIIGDKGFFAISGGDRSAEGRSEGGFAFAFALEGFGEEEVVEGGLPRGLLEVFEETEEGTEGGVGEEGFDSVAASGSFDKFFHFVFVVGGAEDIEEEGGERLFAEVGLEGGDEGDAIVDRGILKEVGGGGEFADEVEGFGGCEFEGFFGFFDQFAGFFLFFGEAATSADTGASGLESANGAHQILAAEGEMPKGLEADKDLFHAVAEDHTEVVGDPLLGTDAGDTPAAESDFRAGSGGRYKFSDGVSSRRLRWMGHKVAPVGRKREGGGWKEG